MPELLVLAGEPDVAVDLVALVAAAVAGGYLANLARLPLVVGYIVGGLAVGPSAAGFVGNIDDIEFIGELGVALLLFSIGLEFPLSQFRKLGNRLIAAAAVQIVALGVGGFLIARAFGLGDAAATLVAGATAFSSTALLVRILSQSARRRSPESQWCLGIALVQDLVAVPILVVLPQLGAGTGSELAQEVGIAIGKGIGLVVAVLTIGRILVPWILRQALAAHSRELFLMTVFALASGVALGGLAAGLSIAFGAFLAGLVTAQSPYATRALHELVPLRDLFAATFFVSIGVLLDLSVIGDSWALFLTVLAWGAIAKVFVIFALARWSRFDASRALAMGLLLGQIGEFSFLFAKSAAGTPAADAASVIIAVGAVSMATSAALIRLGGPIEQALLRIPVIARYWSFEPQTDAGVPALRQHTVIAGYGDSGRELARFLRLRDFPYLVVDSDPRFPEEMEREGRPYIWGDLANSATLEEAGLEHARVLAITIPDVVVAEAIVLRVRQEHPRLSIVARSTGPESQGRLRNAGANAVIQPNLEAGLEIAHHALRRYGLSSAEIRFAQAQRRQEYTGSEEEDAPLH